MANIIDGLEKAHCSELIELTSMMETYTIIKRLYVLIYQIKNLFCKLFRKNFISAGMKIEFQNKKSELLRLDIQKLQKCLREDLIKEIRFAGGFNIGNTDDQISVSMLKAVSSLYRKKQYSFMSPAEIVDDLKVKCEKRNPQIIKILPNIWLWCSLILCLCMIFFTIFFQNKVNLSSIIYIGVFLECGVSFLCRRWLALEKLAQVILLSGRSYGTFFSVQTRELSLCKWSSADSEKFERGLRALHTLQIKIREIITGRDKLYELNDQSEKLYQSNLKFIEEIKNKVTENLMEQEEQKRKIQSYLVENTRLEADKKQRLETIATADKQIQYNENLFNRLSQSLVYIISDLWTKRYTSFRFEDDFFKVLVSGFERFSFEIIESRLLELEKTNDQRSLGKYSNGHYVFEFAIEKKRCALIYDLKNGVNIFAIKREFLPNDVGMSEEKLRDTLIEYGLINKKSVSQKGQSDYIHDSANILIKEMAEQIKKGKETIGKLNKQVDSLALEKKTIELEKKSLIQEKQELTNRLQKLQSVIQQGNNGNLEQLMANEDKLKKQIFELEKRLSQKTAQIDDLQNKFDHTYSEALLELEKQKNQTQKLKDTIDKNNKEISCLKNEYEALKKSSTDLTNQKNLSESTLKKVKSNLDQQKKENSEQKRTYDKLKAAASSMEKTIAEQEKRMYDIEANRTALDTENKSIQKSLEIAENRIREQEKNMKQLKKSLAERQAQLDNAEIFENSNIRKEFERAFYNAKTEIDIISPWLAKFTRERDFYNMLEKALSRGVIIKIRYGFNDNRGGQDITKESFKRLVNADVGSGRDEWSILNIHKLHKYFDTKYPGKLITCRQDSHAKLLIVDKTYYIIGSFNFLSYDGSDAERGEISLKDSNQSVISDMYSRYFEFNTNKPNWITDSFKE